MPDCFISYSSNDEGLASFVRDELQRLNVDVFMASASVRPGERWSPAILAALANSGWVLLLASRAASRSAYVNQEIGVALAGSKRLIPVVWDMSPAEIPGWAAGFQALDLRGSTLEALRQQLVAIAQQIHQDKSKGWLILGALVLGMFAVASHGEHP